MKLQMASCTPSPASGLLPVPARQCHIPKLIDRKTCRPTIRSALGRSPLAGDRRDGLRALRRPQAGSYRSRRGNVISADSPKLIDRKTCRPTIRSALGRSPLAGDRRDGLVHSVARKRAPTGPSAAMSSLLTAPSLSIERCAHEPMRSALGRSPLAGDRRDGLGLSVARKRAPTGPGAAMSSLPTAPSSSSERRAYQPYVRPWVGARVRATLAMASGSPSPPSGRLPLPARQSPLCPPPQPQTSKNHHTNQKHRHW
jgi:hypothetical protein